MKFYSIIISLILCSCTAMARPVAEDAGVRGSDRFDYSPASVRKVLDIQQRRAFDHFWYCSDRNGMIHASGNINNPTVTTGGSGFGAMAVLVGAERGWITRNQALKQIERLVAFLEKADRMHGVWSHWMTPEGKPVKFGKQIEAGDLVETAFMMVALLCAKEYFDGSTTRERNLHEAIDRIWNEIDWKFYTNDEQLLYWAWDRTTGEYHLPVKAYNEALVTYILALAAPQEHAISPEVYRNGWFGTGQAYHPNRKYFGYPMPLGGPYGGPMFLSHYSFLGIDPKISDSYADYWLNGVRHAMVQRHYCMYKAPEEYRYDEYHWGLTACNGPLQPVKKGYKARAPHRDDGVIAPTAALASMPYVPFYAIQVLMNLHYNHPEVQSEYGFTDSYSLVDKWADTGIIAIDQGPIVIMIENYRSGFFWNLLKDNEHICKGLELAGMKSPEYATGFHLAVADLATGCYDMIRHPDRGTYELDFYLDSPQEVAFHLKDDAGNSVWSSPVVSYSSGGHVLRFGEAETGCGRYRMEMSSKDGVLAAVDVALH